MPEIVEEELLHDYNFSISFGDIAQLDVCSGGGCQNLPRDQLEEVLFTNGLDIDKPYQIIYDTHRGITNQVYTTNRIVGFIRSDGTWIEECGENIEVVINDLKTKKKYQGSEDMLDYRYE